MQRIQPLCSQRIGFVCYGNFFIREITDSDSAETITLSLAGISLTAIFAPVLVSTTVGEMRG